MSAQPGDDLELLGSSDRSAQRHACDRISERLAKEPELREQLLEVLRDGSALARFAAAFVLFHRERPTLRLLPTLLEALELPDGDIRWQATHMLTTLGHMTGEVLPVLLHECRAADSPARRRMTLYALRELAPERAETAEAFLQALDDRDPDVRRAALTCFAKLSDPARSALERVLAIARSHADPRMSRIAAIVLPDLLQHHPEARPEVLALVTQLRRSPDASLARAAEAAALRLERD